MEVEWDSRLTRLCCSEWVWSHSIVAQKFNRKWSAKWQVWFAILPTMKGQNSLQISTNFLNSYPSKVRVQGNFSTMLLYTLVLISMRTSQNFRCHSSATTWKLALPDHTLKSTYTSWNLQPTHFFTYLMQYSLRAIDKPGSMSKLEHPWTRFSWPSSEETRACASTAQPRPFSHPEWEGKNKPLTTRNHIFRLLTLCACAAWLRCVRACVRLEGRTWSRARSQKCNFIQ